LGQVAAITLGYWRRPDATTEIIKDGWLDTGDVMQVDDDGYLWFAGRKKQIIVHDGSNICPQEVEEALLEHSAVASAGVIGIHDLVHGENLRAYITLKDGTMRPISQELIRFARTRVGYKAPEDIVLLDHMPLNASGKVDRATPAAYGRGTAWRRWAGLIQFCASTGVGPSGRTAVRQRV
jgi:long-chain acyl-CoA synthetase